MKRWHALLPNFALIMMLTSMVAISFISSYFMPSMLTKTLRLAIIPILLLSYFRKQKIMANVFFVIFVLYYFGMIFSVLDGYSLSSKLSEACIMGAYLLMLFVMIGRLKQLKLQGMVWTYLVLVLLVNGFLMVQVVDAVSENFDDSVSLTLTMGRGVVLMIMAIIAFAIYLSKETSQAILFLTILCCFVFSDILGFITTIYLHFWVFDALQNLLQAVGLLLFCVYVYNHQSLAVGLQKNEIIAKGSRPIPVES